MRKLKTILPATLVCIAAHAQTAPPALALVRQSASYRQAVASVYQQYESSLSTRCPKISLEVAASKASPIGKFETDARGNIVRGTWVETTPGTACGVRRTYNAFIQIGNGKPGVYPLLPGKAYSGPRLQKDAMQYAAIGAQAEPKCAVDVVNTALPSGDPAGPEQPWDEKWTVSACNRRSIVTLHFIPDATGTTIHVSPKETVAAR